MKINSKWMYCSVIMLVMMSMILAGCGRGTSSSNSASGAKEGSADSPVEITYAQWGTAEELQRTQELLDTFMKANPDIKVTLEGKDWSSYWDGLTANAAGGKLPDVMKTSYAYIEKYAQLGIFKELDPLLTSHSFDLNNIDPGILALHQYEGKQVSLPIDANVIVWYYNKALFNDPKTNPKGAKPPVLEPTWDEITQIATQMTIDKNGKTADETGFDSNQIAQWGMSISPGSSIDWFLEPELWSNGAKLINDDGTLALNTPEAKQVLNTFIDLTKTKKINTTPAQIEGLGGQVNLAITTGKVAMNPGGSWNVTNYQEAKTDYGITYLPKFKENKTVVQPAGVAVSAMTEHEEAAYRLASWLAGPDGQTALAQQGYSIPSNKAAADAYLAKAGSGNQIFIDAQQFGIVSPFTAKKTDLVWTYGEQALKLPLAGEGDVQAALDQLASQMN